MASEDEAVTALGHRCEEVIATSLSCYEMSDFGDKLHFNSMYLT